MARFRTLNAGSLPVIIGVAILVVSAWGIYAWRFAAGNTAGAPQEVADAGSGGSTEDSRPKAERITSLRASRPGAPADRQSPPGDGAAAFPAGLSASVTANAPPVLQQEVEMTLGRVEARAAGSASEEFQAARASLAGGNLIATRATLSAALLHDPGASDAAFARRELERIAEVLLFSRGPSPGDPLTGVHVVQGGETLTVIARQYQISEALLASINGIDDPDLIYAGNRLKVIHGPFHVVISKTDHRMDIYVADIMVRSFRVGLGTNGGTPPGTWIVDDKLSNPAWTDPGTSRHYYADDPDNPIGECWIGLRCISGECLGRVGFGIHGTIDPASIGENFSMGCVRMLPDDVAFTFDLLVARQSRVVIE